MLIQESINSNYKRASIFVGAFFCLIFFLSLSSCKEKKSTPDWSQTSKQQETLQKTDAIGRAQTTPSNVESPKKENTPVRFLAYNLRNYLTMHRFSHGKSSTRSKPEKEVRKLINIIQSAHPDILGVCEIGQDKDLKDLQSRLKKAGISLPYIHRTHGDDPVRSLAILSRFPITSTAKPTSSRYTINGKPFQISRGILDVTIQLPNKKIRFLGVHLKSKRPVEEADQAIMRRYESILFRKHIDTILSKNQNALLLAYGDFNDTKHSKAVYTIKGRSHTRNQMEMLNLTDSRGETWTHYWKREDTYSRFDYVFTSKQLTPFIDKRKSCILDLKNAYLASDHRPLFILIQ